MKKGYKFFGDANPASLDQAIDKFLLDRKKVEIRHYGSFTQTPVHTPKGIHIPNGMQQMQLTMMFYALVVFEPNEEDIKNDPQFATVSVN